MKKHFLWFPAGAFYGLVVYAIYSILPPAISVEVALAPAKYMHVQEDPVTASRAATVYLLQPYDEVRRDLENFYRECGKTRQLTVRVMATGNQDTTSYRFVIQEIAAKISRKQIDCSIEMMHKKQDALWDFLLSKRRLIPPASLEKEKFSMIEINDMTESGRLKAIIRAAVLGLVLFVLAYSCWMLFLRARQSRSIGIDT